VALVAVVAPMELQQQVVQEIHLLYPRYKVLLADKVLLITLLIVQLEAVVAHPQLVLLV
jgi:hypothetical protein